MSLSIGILGGAVLMAGWTYETIKSIKNHKELIDLYFALFYLVGVSLLTYYSWYIQDVVFLWLNFILLTVIIIEVIYTLYLRRK